MPKIIATNQAGTTVLLEYPKPNGFNVPSSLYAKAGFAI